MFENLFYHQFKWFSFFGYKKKMFKRKYLATNEEKTVGDAARNVAVVIIEAVDLQSMFENLLYHHFK